MTLAGPMGSRSIVVNDRSVGNAFRPGSTLSRLNTGRRPTRRLPQPYQAHFPALGGYWPKHNWRRLWTWATRWSGKRRYGRPPMEDNPEWDAIHHLPCQVRLDYRTHLFTRINVPIDEVTTRQVYTHFTTVNNPLGKLYEVLMFHLFHRWAHFTNFSIQDFRAAGPQRYDTPENLSATDSHLTMWRRLLTKARGLEGLEPDKVLPTTPAEELAEMLQSELEAQREAASPS